MSKDLKLINIERQIEKIEDRIKKREDSIKLYNYFSNNLYIAVGLSTIISFSAYGIYMIEGFTIIDIINFSLIVIVLLFLAQLILKKIATGLV